MRSCVLSAAVLLALATVARAEDPPKPRLVTKVFAVADLVTPIPDYTAPVLIPCLTPEADIKHATLADHGERLVQCVTSMIRPRSWDAAGGAGRAEFYALGCSLVVRNTPEVVAEVGECLEALRRLQDRSIATEVRILTVPAGFCERVGIKHDACQKLSELEFKLLTQAAEGNRDANVMLCPKVTTFDGQTATIRIGDTKKYVTGIEAKAAEGKLDFAPTTRTVELGHTFTLCAKMSADQKFVNLSASLTSTRELGESGGYPIQATISLIPEGGGNTLPRPQLFRLPVLDTAKVEKSVVVPSGGTVVLGGWTETGPARPLQVPHKIPYLDRFPAREAQREAIVLATTRVIDCGEAKCASTPYPRVYRLKHAAAADAEKAVQKLLDTKQLAGRVTSDSASNTVYYEAKPVVEEQILELLAAMDVAPPARVAAVRTMQNRAAADVAEVVKKHFGTVPGMVVTAEPVSNTVLVSGEAAVMKRATAMLAELDAAPAQTMIQALVMEVPQGWLADIGLGSEGGKPLVLTEREVAMFQAAIRREKEKGGIDILSRPQMQMADNQTGRVQVSGQVMISAGLEIVAAPQGGLTVARKMVPAEAGVRLMVTPRTEPKDGTIMLRVESHVSSVSQNAVTVPLSLPREITGLKEPVTYRIDAIGAVNTQAMQTTIAGVRDGQTVILSGGIKKEKQVVVTAAGERKEEGEIARETLIILTPHRVRGDAVRPAGAVMPAPAPPMPAPYFVPDTTPHPAIMPAPVMPSVAPTTASYPVVMPAPVVTPTTSPQGWFLPAPGTSAPVMPPAPAPIPGPLPNGGILPATPRPSR